VKPSSGPIVEAAHREHLLTGIGPAGSLSTILQAASVIIDPL